MSQELVIQAVSVRLGLLFSLDGHRLGITHKAFTTLHHEGITRRNAGRSLSPICPHHPGRVNTPLSLSCEMAGLSSHNLSPTRLRLENLKLKQGPFISEYKFCIYYIYC